MFHRTADQSVSLTHLHEVLEPARLDFLLKMVDNILLHVVVALRRTRQTNLRVQVFHRRREEFLLNINLNVDASAEGRR